MSREMREKMKNSFSKQRHNPIELMKKYWPNAGISHIEYDPNMKKGEYFIIRQSGGDGTMLFTLQMLQEALVPLINMQSFYKPKDPGDWSGVKAIKYKIGPMRHVTCFGMIFLKCSSDHKYPGQRERVRIPVSCEIVYT